MQINFTLRFSALLCMLAYVVLTVSFLGVTGIFIHMQIHPEYYVSWNATAIFSPTVFMKTIIEKWNTAPSTDSGLFSIGNIKWYSMYLNCLQILARLMLIFFAVREFHNIIRSVAFIETFHRKNIGSFRKIGQYMFGLFILSGFITLDASEASFRGYAIHFTPIILSAIAYMMSEIFRQGNQLLDENQLTI